MLKFTPALRSPDSRSVQRRAFVLPVLLLLSGGLSGCAGDRQLLSSGAHRTAAAGAVAADCHAPAQATVGADGSPLLTPPVPTPQPFMAEIPQPQLPYLPETAPAAQLTVPQQSAAAGVAVHSPSPVCDSGPMTDEVAACRQEAAELKRRLELMESEISTYRRSHEVMTLSQSTLSRQLERVSRDNETLQSELRRLQEFSERQHQQDLQSLDTLSQLIERQMSDSGTATSAEQSSHGQ